MTEEKSIGASARTKIYFRYLILVLIFVEILDTYTTNYPNVIPSQVIKEFLADYPQNVAQSIFAIIIGFATIGMYFVFLNQYFADKLGRKILLAFTVFGMGFSSLLILLSTNIIQYAIYLFMLYVFFSSDIWVIYINEECPPGKRGFWTNMILVGGVTGAILLPIFRSIYISETVSNWRGMTLFAIFLGIPLSIIILLTLQETSKYQEIKVEKQLVKSSSVGLKTNLKILFSSSRKKEFIILLIISYICGLNYTFIALGENFISNSPNLNQNDVNIIVLVMSLCVIFGYLITGLIADKYGRKILVYLYSFLLPIAIFIIVFGSYSSKEYALIFVCIGAGLANIAFWGLGVVLKLVTIEIIPTETRGTGSGIKSLITAIGITSGLFLGSLFIFFFGLEFVFLFFSLLLLINLPLAFFYLKETKGINLSEIK
jgi:MFS family permease